MRFVRLYINGQIWDNDTLLALRLMSACDRTDLLLARRTAPGSESSRLARQQLGGLVGEFGPNSRRRSCADLLSPATVVLFLGFSATIAVAADDIVPTGAELELLYTRSAPIKGGLTEGVAAAPDGSMYFSEIPFGDDKGMIMRFDPKSKTTSVFAKDSHKSNGLMFDAKGFLIACEGSDGGGRGVAKWNVKTGERTVIADRYQGQAIQRL